MIDIDKPSTGRPSCGNAFHEPLRTENSIRAMAHYTHDGDGPQIFSPLFHIHIDIIIFEIRLQTALVIEQ